MSGFGAFGASPRLSPAHHARARHPYLLRFRPALPRDPTGDALVGPSAVLGRRRCNPHKQGTFNTTPYSTPTAPRLANGDHHSFI
jgi:hypothetical protein